MVPKKRLAFSLQQPGERIQLNVLWCVCVCFMGFWRLELVRVKIIINMVRIPPSLLCVAKPSTRLQRLWAQWSDTQSLFLNFSFLQLEKNEQIRIYWKVETQILVSAHFLQRLPLGSWWRVIRKETGFCEMMWSAVIVVGTDGTFPSEKHPQLTTCGSSELFLLFLPKTGNPGRSAMTTTDNISKK